MTAWTQQINRHDIVRPTCLNGKTNGKLDTTSLSVVKDGAGKRIGRLNLMAARAWTAMVAAAKSDGIILTATDTYRDYATQQRLWDTRYDGVNHGNGGRTCGGEHRYLKDGMATAACPGTSNHGWGGAVDKGNNAAAHEWLEIHASAFGWEWELSSEPWHLHYWPGDQLPQSVLDFEAHNNQEDFMAGLSEQEQREVLEGVRSLRTTFNTDDGHEGPLGGVLKRLDVFRARMDPDAFAERIASKLDGKVDGLDKAEIKEAVKAAMREGTGD